ncbi:MAG: T9SS type A sorting domain-containing protein [Cytophagales bacterium]|nr:T9SS type A sorting domain-containing protein [Cytophagales bacterium]
MNFTGSSKNLGTCSIASASAYPMNFSPYFSITYNKTPAGWNSYNLVGIKDWVLRTGTICARIPVVANSVCALSTDWINLTGYQNEDKKYLSWQIQGNDFDSYTLQESSNGTDFIDIATFNNQETTRNYSITKSSSHYFRIRVDKTSGNSAFSNVILISDRFFEPSVTVFPNPSSSSGSGNIISNFEINTVEIYDRTGRLVLSDQTNKSNEYPKTAGLPDGLYSIRIIGDQVSKVISWVVLP